MPSHTIRVDDAGYFFEDDDRFACDWCGAIADIEDSRATDDRRYMCPDCFDVLWNAESEAVTAYMQRENILFCTMTTDLDALLEEHEHLLDGRRKAGG